MKPRVRVPFTTNKAITPDPDYHGAAQTRRIVGFGVSSAGPNAVLGGNIATLRNRSRHAYRNIPLIKKATNTNVSNEIGIGIKQRFRSENKDFNEAMRKAFNIWSNECSSDGTVNFYGAQSQIALARRMSGDCFIRRRKRKTDSGLLIPFQIQIIESDFVPHSLNEVRKNGNKIKQGIEFNRIGKKVAYWMYKEHPGEKELNINFNQFIRVPEKDVIHTFKATRPGQIRGEPDSSQAIIKAKTFDQYDDFELQRKEAKSGYTGILTRQEFDDSDYNYDPFTGNPIYEEEGQPELAILPGTILTGLPGESMTLFDGDNTGSGYKDFMREQKLSIAASQNIPFELMTGDWSGVNDRIYRAFINEYRRGIDADRDHLTIFQVCRVIKDWFIQAAVLSGIYTPKDYLSNIHDYHYVEFRPHAWKHIHPVQDINAKILEINNGLKSSDAVIAESGFDGEDVDKQQIEIEVRRKQLREEAGLDDNSVQDSPPDKNPTNN